MRFFLTLLCTAVLAVVVKTTNVQLTTAGNSCPSGYQKITTMPECRAGLKLVGHLGQDYLGPEDESDWPSGCYYCDGVDNCLDGTWLNTHSTGSSNGGAKPYCVSLSDGFTVGRTLFIGDSDIDYWDTGSYFPGTYNVGVGGYTCKDVKDEVENLMSVLQPSKVVLVCGENDLSSGASVSKTFERLEAVVTKIIEASATVVYIGTKPEPSTSSLHDEYQEYDQLIKNYARVLASESSIPPLTVIDSYNGFEGLGNPTSLYDDDKLHLSEEGYSHWSTWGATALEDTKCILWLSDVCIESLESDSPTTFSPTMSPPASEASASPTTFSPTMSETPSPASEASAR